MIKRLRLQVFGKVQKVGYRYQTRATAQSLSLVGYVTNRPDDSVMVLAEGDKKALVQLLQACQKGPATARVDKIIKSWENATNEFTDFKIITT